MIQPPVRVLMLTDVYFPRVNGVSTSIETFREDLLQQGVPVTLVAPAYPTPHVSADTWRVRSRRLPFDPEDRLMRWRPLITTAMRAAAPGLDLVHIQTPFAAHYAGLRVARRFRVPIVATYHTHFEEYIQHYLPLLPKRFLQGIARRMARHQCRELDAVVVPSPEMRERLLEYGIEKPMHVLPTGIPVDRFAHGDGSTFRGRHGIPPEQPVALYVGRVAHEKNIEFLLRAMDAALAGRPDLLLLIAGEGPALASLQRLSASLGLERHVRFVGYLDRQAELPDCYAAADMFVFASRTETQGLVLLEAMAAGLPVFAVPYLGTRSIVEPRRGAIVAPDDPDSFGRELATHIGNRHALRQLAQEGRKFAAEWSAPERARQLGALYRSLVPSTR
ncbi:MAG TPA: glycosyltransferase [Rhodocyclaceae bacterium]|nr:glycosyltransferase [Rhodocyclaceae bacterium]